MSSFWLCRTDDERIGVEPDEFSNIIGLYNVIGGFDASGVHYDLIRLDEEILDESDEYVTHEHVVDTYLRPEYVEVIPLGTSDDFIKLLLSGRMMEALTRLVQP